LEDVKSLPKNRQYAATGVDHICAAIVATQISPRQESIFWLLTVLSLGLFYVFTAVWTSKELDEIVWATFEEAEELSIARGAAGCELALERKKIREKARRCKNDPLGKPHTASNLAAPEESGSQSQSSAYAASQKGAPPQAAPSGSAAYHAQAAAQGALPAAARADIDSFHQMIARQLQGDGVARADVEKFQADAQKIANAGGAIYISPWDLFSAKCSAYSARRAESLKDVYDSFHGVEKIFEFMGDYGRTVQSCARTMLLNTVTGTTVGKLSEAWKISLVMIIRAALCDSPISNLQMDRLLSDAIFVASLDASSASWEDDLLRADAAVRNVWSVWLELHPGWGATWDKHGTNCNFVPFSTLSYSMRAEMYTFAQNLVRDMGTNSSTVVTFLWSNCLNDVDFTPTTFTVAFRKLLELVDLPIPADPTDQATHFAEIHRQIQDMEGFSEEFKTRHEDLAVRADSWIRASCHYHVALKIIFFKNSPNAQKIKDLISDYKTGAISLADLLKVS
jgi:hypothetical protein